MASDVLTLQPSARFGLPSVIPQVAFLALLLLAFVGLAPFSPRYPEVLALGESGVTGAGDLARQVLYLTVFGCVLAGAIDKRGIAAFSIVPVTMAVLLLWCVASALWAVEGGVTFRRAMLEIIITVSAMLSIQTLGAERSLQILRGVLIAVLVVNFASIFITSHAVHQPGELDPSVVGDWRGLYYHKNIAGGVSAISALVFLYFAIARRSTLDWILLAVAVFFTVMTRSKSSLLLLPVAVIMGAVYFRVWRRPLERSIALVVIGLFVLALATVVLADSGLFARLLQDPAEFTGRTAIWQAQIAFIQDYPLLGSGFGSFTDTGAGSPLHNYVGAGWVETVAHGHNAYLQLLVTIGGIGFVLAMIVIIAQPLRDFWQQRDTDAMRRAFLFALFVFLVLHNFLESDFLEGDSALWLMTVLVITILRLEKTEGARGQACPIP